jgi:hypothetical protein
MADCISKNRSMKPILTILCRTAFRAWLAFAAWMFLGWSIGILLDGDNPLRSDDPYCIGLIFGVVAACMAGAYGLVELFKLSQKKTSDFYLFLLGIWCIFLFTMSWIPRVGGEAQVAEELLLHFTAASAIIGVSVWPLCIKKLPRFCAGGISAVGITLLAMYGFVMLRYY